MFRVFKKVERGTDDGCVWFGKRMIPISLSEHGPKGYKSDQLRVIKQRN